jgi:hypothetical protein
MEASVGEHCRRGRPKQYPIDRDATDDAGDDDRRDHDDGE